MAGDEDALALARRGADARGRRVTERVRVRLLERAHDRDVGLAHRQSAREHCPHIGSRRCAQKCSLAHELQGGCGRILAADGGVVCVRGGALDTVRHELVQPEQRLVSERGTPGLDANLRPKRNEALERHLVGGGHLPGERVRHGAVKPGRIRGFRNGEWRATLRCDLAPQLVEHSIRIAHVGSKALGVEVHIGERGKDAGAEEVRGSGSRRSRHAYILRVRRPAGDALQPVHQQVL
mmetsp:Transcript_13010/g.33901  ORF Transcript_13010/g.33901 Transcript_13010/m.33901 type:complete len:237 (+) Transcript_13010:772-1482(+)